MGETVDKQEKSSMPGNILYRLDPALICLILLFVLLLAEELGFRLDLENKDGEFGKKFYGVRKNG